MRSILMGGAMLALMAPATAFAAPVKVKPSATAKKLEAANKAPELDMAQMMALFDKLFPAQPDPPAARLALSRTAVQGLFPDGTYARMMDGMTRGIADRVMGLTEADFGGKPASGKAPKTLTLREKLAKDDPNFDARMEVIERIIGEELAKMAAIIEPRMREGLARSMARRFDEKQLSDLNAFLATDSGKAFGSQSMAMYVDPDVMRAMMTSLPEMMTQMPAAMKRIETETAQFPKAKNERPAPKS